MALQASGSESCVVRISLREIREIRERDVHREPDTPVPDPDS
jgi:hypothetical protein